MMSGTLYAAMRLFLFAGDHDLRMNSPDNKEDLYRYARRHSREVIVGGVGVGGDNPIRVQSS